MQTLNFSNKEIVKSTRNNSITYSHFAHIYKTKEGKWRGFFVPYDVTYEARTKKEVEEVLPKMVTLYEDGLKKYNNPSHLISVPLSHDEDREEFISWVQQVTESR
jgi:hypothetical protein